ncbi:Uncharacterised protein [Vibrio cholerae]|nr:Uncharacterised protein [Vibrio cholerae]
MSRAKVQFGFVQPHHERDALIQTLVQSSIWPTFFNTHTFLRWHIILIVKLITSHCGITSRSGRAPR